VGIRDATHLWGKSTWETEDLIKEELGDKQAQILSIGPGGENLAKSAELSEICALKSEELYRIYLINSQNKINLNLFWEELFNTNGIFNMKSFLNKIGYKE